MACFQGIPHYPNCIRKMFRSNSYHHQVAWSSYLSDKYSRCCYGSICMNQTINSLSLCWFYLTFREGICKLNSMIDDWGISRNWPPADDKSTLVQVMAWCRQATSHYLNQGGPICLAPYCDTRPQWVNQIMQRAHATRNMQTGTSYSQSLRLGIMISCNAWYRRGYRQLWNVSS